MKGGGFPVFIDKGDGDAGIGIAADEAGDFVLVEPLLDGAGALIENPGVGIGIAKEAFEFPGGVLEVKEAGGDELEAEAALAEEVAEGVEFDEHPGWELCEAFWGEEGDAFGGGPPFSGGSEDASAFPVFVGGDDSACFESAEGGTKGITSDLELGGEGALTGEEPLQVTGEDHLLNHLGSLGGEGLAVGDPGHGESLTGLKMRPRDLEIESCEFEDTSERYICDEAFRNERIGGGGGDTDGCAGRTESGSRAAGSGSSREGWNHRDLYCGKHG